MSTFLPVSLRSVEKRICPSLLKMRTRVTPSWAPMASMMWYAMLHWFSSMAWRVLWRTVSLKRDAPCTTSPMSWARCARMFTHASTPTRHERDADRRRR